MFLVAAIFWMSAMSGFSLSYAACDGNFSIDEKLGRCQRPVIFAWLSWASVGLGLSLGAIALFRTLPLARK